VQALREEFSTITLAVKEGGQTLGRQVGKAKKDLSNLGDQLIEEAKDGKLIAKTASIGLEASYSLIVENVC